MVWAVTFDAGFVVVFGVCSCLDYDGHQDQSRHGVADESRDAHRH